MKDGDVMKPSRGIAQIVHYRALNDTVAGFPTTSALREWSVLMMGEDVWSV